MNDLVDQKLMWNDGTGLCHLYGALKMMNAILSTLDRTGVEIVVYI